MPIWILESSRDGGKTWFVSQPYHVYKTKEKGQSAEKRYQGYRIMYRIREYRPVEG